MCYSNRCSESRITGMVAIELYKMHTEFLLNVSLFVYMQCTIYWVLIITLCTLGYYFLCVSGCDAKNVIGTFVSVSTHSSLSLHCICMYMTMITCVCVEGILAMCVRCWFTSTDFTFHSQILFCHFMFILMFSQCPHPFLAWQFSYFNFLLNTVSQLVHFFCGLLKFGEGHFALLFLLTGWGILMSKH